MRTKSFVCPVSFAISTFCSLKSWKLLLLYSLLDKHVQYLLYIVLWWVCLALIDTKFRMFRWQGLFQDPMSQRKILTLISNVHVAWSIFLDHLVGLLTQFDRDSWQLRTNADHHRKALQHRNQATKSGREECLKFGCSYSVLLDLPYFDAPRVVDPMHNLFLGSAKHIFKSVSSMFIIRCQCKYNSRKG